MSKEAFCVNCAQKDAQYEIMYQRLYDEVQDLKHLVAKLESDNERLSLDLAFYNGNIINLSCNGK